MLPRGLRLAHGALIAKAKSLASLSGTRTHASWSWALAKCAYRSRNSIGKGKNEGRGRDGAVQEKRKDVPGLAPGSRKAVYSF